jgi:hypothetical protein
MRGSARSQEIELLADELKELVAWGATPERLALKPVLRELAAVPPSLPRITAGCIVRRYLDQSISSLAGNFDFQENNYIAHTMNRAYRLLLGFEGSGYTADRRRYRVMELLGLDHSCVAWRRNPDNERAFLVILAEHMVGRTNVQTTDQTST